MVHTIFALLLLAGALVASGLAARDHARAPAATSPMIVVALLCASIIAIMGKTPPTFFYKGSIVLALLIALLAMALMMIEGTPQIVRVGANVSVYFILWLGFLVTAGRAFWSWPGLIAFMVGIAAVAALFLALRKKLAWLSVSAGIYALNAAMVIGGVAALVALRPALWSILALLGALLFTGVDGVAAWAQWRTPLPRAAIYQALFLTLGALLLSASVWGDALRTLWPFS